MDLSTPEKVARHLREVAAEITTERMTNADHPLAKDREFRDRRLEVAFMLLYPKAEALSLKVADLTERLDKLQHRVDVIDGAPGFITEDSEPDDAGGVAVPPGSTPWEMAKAIRDARLAEIGPRNLVAELMARAGR